MKITSHWRAFINPVVKDKARITMLLGQVTIKQDRHYNGNEKFYEIRLDKEETERLRQLFNEPKPKLVQLAEKLDSLINKVRSKFK